MAPASDDARAGSPSPGLFVVLQGHARILQLTPSADQLASVYYVVAGAAPAPAATLTLAQTWAIPGWYVFAPPSGIPASALSGVEQLINTKGNITGTSLLQHAFVWLGGPPLSSTPPLTWPPEWEWLGMQRQGNNFFTANTPNPFPTFAWGQLQLSFSQSCSVALDGSAGFSITNISSNALAISFGTGPGAGQKIALPQSNNPWSITLPILGPAAGSFIFVVALDLENLIENFGLGFIYAYGASPVNALYYPAVVPPASPGVYLTLQAYLNPVLPFAGAATRIVPGSAFTPVPRVPTVASLPAPYFFNTQGAPLTLDPVLPDAPELPAGSLPGCFAFSVAPPGSVSNLAQGAVLYHLSPVGCYKLTAASPPPPQIDVMPGLSAIEFLQLQPEDIVQFVNNQPAYAPQFSAASSPPALLSSPPVASGPLTDTYTTSWATVLPSSGTRGYFGQPTTSTYFGPPAVAGSPWQYPLAVEAMLWSFSAGTPVPFPLVPYGAVFQYSAASPHGVVHPAGLAGAVELMMFEASVLANQRHACLAQMPGGPVFMPMGANAPSASLKAVTNPQGLIVDLNADGTWQKITLARQPPPPSSPPTYLEIDLTTVTPPLAIANVLTRDQLFLVVTNPTVLGNFVAANKNTLTMAEFEFLFDIGESGGAGMGTILVMKFNDKVALADLIAQPSLWADTDTFVTDVTATAQVLQEAIATANKPNLLDDPFEFFRTLSTTPSWTGILAFNVQIDGNGMPPDLQMLLGGIKGDLRAHHFGVETNRFDITGSPTVEHSSLFGVIYYENPALEKTASPSPPSPSPSSPDAPLEPDYEVEELVVLFSNSAIAQFHCSVGLTVPALFGRTVTLQPVASPPSPPPPANTFEINGRYQTHDGIGTVTFNSTETFNFDFLPSSKPGVTRVLETVKINAAQLVPVSSTAATPSPSTDVVCAFHMQGELWFNPDPFGSNLDLYSYGNTADGLGMAFTGLTVTIAFTLGATGSMEPGSKKVTLDVSGLTPAPDYKAVRDASFLETLPFQFSRFVTGDTLTASAASAAPVHVPQLVTPGATSSPASPGVTQGPPAAPTPAYAFEYDISLGSLGSLSDVQAGITAKLLLGWGPSPVAPDNDAACILVALPQLSAGVAGFSLEGILKTQFGDANLVKVTPDSGGTVYAVLFTNVQLSVFGYSFPPGVLIDFMLFAGPPPQGQSPGASNLAWFLAAEQQKQSP